jgi:hypothetical protein
VPGARLGGPGSLGCPHCTPPPVTATVPPASLSPEVRPDPLGRFGPNGGQYVPETL